MMQLSARELHYADALDKAEHLAMVDGVPMMVEFMKCWQCGIEALLIHPTCLVAGDSECPNCRTMSLRPDGAS